MPQAEQIPDYAGASGAVHRAQCRHQHIVTNPLTQSPLYVRNLLCFGENLHEKIVKPCSLAVNTITIATMKELLTSQQLFAYSDAELDKYLEENGR